MVYAYNLSTPLGRMRQEDHEFEASLGYTVKPCLKNARKCIKPFHVLVSQLSYTIVRKGNIILMLQMRKVRLDMMNCLSQSDTTHSVTLRKF
jgi:hypothetical protein